VDITSAVPTKAGVNVWTGSNDFSGSTVTGVNGYDPTSSTVFNFDEEFLCGGATSLTVGCGNWAFTFNVGAPTISYTTAATHPGIISVTTGSGGADGAAVVSTSGAAAVLTGMNGKTFKLRTVFQTGVNNTNLSDFDIGMGYFGANAILVKYAPGTSGNLNLVTCISGTCTTTSSGVAWVASTWYDCLIDSQVAGTVGIACNGNARVTTSSNIPSGSMEAVAIRMTTTAAQAQTMLIDKWALHIDTGQRY
jgi:hypothetical protein